jgi:preprotein translocase subunit SecG
MQNGEFMIAFLTIIHVIVCLFLILVILLQQAKSADWAGAFGGGGSQTAFGSRTAGTLLTKATTIAAVLFMVTSMALTILVSRSTGGSSVIHEGAKQTTQPAATPPRNEPPKK